MRRTRTIFLVASTALLALGFATLARELGPTPPRKDPLAAEIERWSAYLRDNTATDEDWTQIKAATQPALESAAEALRDGRRLFALQRLAAARAYLSASRYVSELPTAERKDSAGFEAEWARTGTLLRADLGTPAPAALDGVRPAAVRAIGEAALPQVKAYYDASLEYGRNTMAKYGLFYLGTARAQRELVAFCRSLSAPTDRRVPPLRTLQTELDRLEAELLEAYRPPASIEQHSEFIAASSTLNEARGLDTAGLRYGALLRYLQAAQRLAPLRPAGKTIDASALATELRELDARLSTGGLDHSIGRIFLEAAQADLKAAAPGATPAAATAAATDVISRYFAALEPARPAGPRPAPQVTVTLVRWPYT